MNKTSIEWTDYTAGLIKSTHAGGPVSFDEWEARRILRTRTTGKRILMQPFARTPLRQGLPTNDN